MFSGNLPQNRLLSYYMCCIPCRVTPSGEKFTIINNRIQSAFYLFGVAVQLYHWISDLFDKFSVIRTRQHPIQYIMTLESSVYVFQCFSYFYVYNFRRKRLIRLYESINFMRIHIRTNKGHSYTHSRCLTTLLVLTILAVSLVAQLLQSDLSNNTKTFDVNVSSNSEWYKDLSQIGLFLRIVLLTTKDSMMAMEIVIIVPTYARIVEDFQYKCMSNRFNHSRRSKLYRKLCKTTRGFSEFSGIAVLAFVIDILLNCGLTIGNTLSDGFSLWYSCILLSLFTSSYVMAAANSRKASKAPYMLEGNVPNANLVILIKYWETSEMASVKAGCLSLTFSTFSKFIDFSMLLFLTVIQTFSVEVSYWKSK